MTANAMSCLSSTTESTSRWSWRRRRPPWRRRLAAEAARLWAAPGLSSAIRPNMTPRQSPRPARRGLPRSRATVWHHLEDRRRPCNRTGRRQSAARIERLANCGHRWHRLHKCETGHICRRMRDCRDECGRWQREPGTGDPATPGCNHRGDTMSEKVIPDLKWVTDRKRSTLPLAETARHALDGGVNLVHIRENTADRTELDGPGQGVARVIGDRAAVVVNSDIVVAKNLGMGIHLPEALDVDIQAHTSHSSVDRCIRQRQARSSNTLTISSPGTFSKPATRPDGSPWDSTGSPASSRPPSCLFWRSEGLRRTEWPTYWRRVHMAWPSCQGSARWIDPGDSAARYRAALDSARMEQSGGHCDAGHGQWQVSRARTPMIDSGVSG